MAETENVRLYGLIEALKGIEQKNIRQMAKDNRQLREDLNRVMEQQEMFHGAPDTLYEPVRYIMGLGGKRLRPILVVATYRLFRQDIGRCLPFAIAIEMVHNFSLIHDDLPSVDDDDLRRGKPTNHKVFGEAMALFAGDALLTLCFEILAQLNLPASIKTQLIAHLAKAAGPSGIVAGQASDVQAEKQHVPLARLVQIHERKTGALLQYCFVAAGIVANGSKEQLTLLKTLGMDVGIAFQVRDDLLDILATTQELGKTAGRDLELEKSTYPALLGIQGAKQALADYLLKAKQACQMLAEDGMDMTELVRIIEKLELRD